MKGLLGYLKGYRKECILAPLMKLLEASFELAVPLVMASIIDNGVGGNDRTLVWRLGAVLVLLGIVGLVSAVTAQFFAAKAAIGFGTAVKQALFRHTQSLSFSQLDALGGDTLLTRMTADVNQVQNGVNMLLRLFLRSPFIVFGAMVMAFTVNARCAVYFVILIPVLSVVVFAVMLISIPLFGKVQHKLDGLLGITKENLTGTRVIRAFNRQGEERERFSAQNRALTRMQLIAGRVSAVMNPATYLIVNLFLILLIRRGALTVDSGIITQGALVALINYMSQILVELIKLANLIISLNKAAASGKRIADIMTLKPDMTYPETTESGAPDGKITFENVSLSYYENAQSAIDGISFSVPLGSVVGVIGGTGSGKSTLVHALCRFYDVTRGAVSIDGTDVKNYSEMELRGKIGIVMQNAALFSGTVRENLQLAKPDASDAEMENALADAQALDFVQQKKGLDTQVEADGHNFSGGQRQRLSVARTLVKRPEILILDDSASALDYATDAKLRQAIAALPYHPTVFIISQRASSVMHADTILVLEDGRLVGAGKSDDLLHTCESYREIYETQFPTEKGAAV